MLRRESETTSERENEGERQPPVRVNECIGRGRGGEGRGRENE